MESFNKILVAVDLAEDDRLVTETGPPHSRHAVQEALWLSRGGRARLTFFHALDISDKAQWLIQESEDLEHSIVDQARDSLQKMVDRAAAEGIEADYDVAFGRSWQQVIEKATQGEYDLVIAGTRHQGPLRTVLFGSTGMKLLRKCPVPVWITHPRENRELRSVVVATDFSEVSNRSIDAGAALAAEYGAQLHVLHVIHPAITHQLRGIGLPLEKLEEHQRQERENAEKQLQEQIQRPAVKALPQPPNVILATGEPDEEILKTLEDTQADVLVMATVGRSGIPGLVIGNTAERLLPHVQCSVLAVKPDGFTASA